MKILSIETSHDDTSVALYKDKEILKEITLSQTEFHKQYGGTVPEYASRHHAISLGIILDSLLKEFDISDIDHVAYTEKPGLIGSLQMGRLFAFAVALALDKPIYPINHMFAHIYSVAFTNDIIYPSLALVVSGGHTQIWYVKDKYNIEIVNETQDDAVGEVYDKVARKLGLGFPGGPVIDKLAHESATSIDFKILDREDSPFSFSGLKTKVIDYIHNKKQKGESLDIPGICKGFQEAIINNTINKMKHYINKYNPSSIILGGGVSANSYLRSEFKKLHEFALIPDMKYTGDNASMIAIRSDIINGEGT